jgi:hypothetical protein
MRRPVSVKPFLSFFIFHFFFFISSFSKLSPLSQAASVATLPSALFGATTVGLGINAYQMGQTAWDNRSQIWDAATGGWKWMNGDEVNVPYKP